MNLSMIFVANKQKSDGLAGSNSQPSVKNAVVTRRVFLRKAATTTAAIVAAATLLAGSPGTISAQDDVSAAASGFYRTTDYLNLRTGPGTAYSVVKVLPPQSPLSGIGPESGAFVKVSSQGTIGWVHGDYIAVGNGGSSDTPVPLGTKYASDSVNMRKGPGTGYQVLNVIPQGTAVSVYDGFQNNFQLVSYNGAYGWVSLDYLAANGGQPSTQLRTTTALNLRSQPSLSGGVLLVIPANTYVRSSDQLSNGFRMVTVESSGTTGWAHDDYLV